MASPSTPSATEDPDGARSWQRYRLLSDRSTDAIFEVDLDGTVQWVSPTVRNLLDWAPTQCSGRPFLEFVHPLDADRVAAVCADVARGQTAYESLPCMMRTANDSYRALTLHARPLLDTDEAASSVVVTASDTHDRDSALRALATLTQANRAVVRATDETTLLQQMCDVVIETGRYTFAWYGRPVDDHEQSVAAIAHAGQDQGYLDEITVSWGDNPLGHGPTGRCLRTHQTQVLNDFTPDPEYQPWLAAATRRGFRSSIALPVLLGNRLDGALMVYAAEPGSFDALSTSLLEDLVADLGHGIESLRSTGELVRTSQRLQAALDSMIDPYIVFESVRDDAGELIDLRYAEANDAAREYSTTPWEEVLGTGLLSRLPGQLESGPLRHYFHAIETGEPVILDDYPYEHELLGSTRRYDIRGARCGDGLVVAFRDVTDRHAEAGRLADSERRYRLLAENSSDVIMLATVDTNMSWVSASSLQTLGWPAEDLIGRRATEFIHPEDIPALQTVVMHSATTGETARPRYRWRRPDGTYRWMEAAGRNITAGAERVVSLRDIDAQVQAEHELAAREEHYRLLAENASDVVWRVAPNGVISWVSRSVVRVLGWRPDEIVGRTALDLVHPEDRARALHERGLVLAGQSTQGEFRFQCADGTFRWMGRSITPIATEDGIARVASLRDIEDEVASRTRLEFALGHDLVTGLPTRQGMLDRVSHLQGQLTGRQLLAVLCIGVDALAEVNEALSHGAGDIVLQTVAARIAEASGQPDLVGRGTGDEFIVIIPAIDAGGDAADPAERIRTGIHGAFGIGGHQISPTVSIGIAIGDRDSEGEGLLRDAALALRRAKQSGRDRCAFVEESMAADAEHRIRLEARIREGLATGAFVPWLQPIVSLVDGRIVGHEALCRWQQPDRVLEPNGFLSVAARSSLITDIDLAMIDPVASALARLPEQTFIAVNVTGQTLARTDYSAIVRDALATHGVRADRLHLEITETMLLTLNDHVVGHMRALAEVGARWYVDDFGTGYSSISHLRDLPVAGLKLDMSFTAGIGAGEPTARQLANALVGLANGLGLDTVAEGIETDAEAAYLRTLGWRHGQGWLYGRAAPLPAD